MIYEMNNFEKDVIERSYTIPVLVDFWAEWCAPCRVLGPVLERLAEKYKDQWTLMKVNTEHHPDIAASYDIQGIPNVKLFVDGQVVDEFAGALPEETVEQWLRKAVPSKYQEQIKKARQLLLEGKLRKARKLLRKVVEAEPGNHQARIFLANTYLYTDYQKSLELVKDIGEGSDYIDMAESIRTFAELFQLNDQPETLPDSSARDQYLTAIKKLHDEDFEGALEAFLTVIRRDRYYDDDGSRKACIAIFTFLGEDHEITPKYRRELGSALFS